MRGAGAGGVRAHVLVCVLLTVAIWAVYAQVAGHGYTNFDDEVYVVRNPAVAAGLSWHGLVWAFTTAHEAYWIPLTWLSFMLDVSLFGLDPGAQLLVNVGLHTVGALLLYGLMVRMTGRLGPSAFVAAVFALHPVHVESVAWIAQRKDVLSTLFALLAMHAHVGFVRRPTLGRRVAVVVWFALGVLAKPMVVTVPVLLVLLDAWPLGRIRDRAALVRVLVEKIPLGLVAVAAATMVVVTQRAAGAVPALAAVPLGLRVSNALTAYVRYLGMLVWPSGLAVFYPLAPVPAWQVAGAVAVLLGVSVVALRWARSAPWLLVGWLWYLVMLLPVIGFVQVGGQALADRYLHLPSIGITIALAWSVAAAARHRPVARLVAAGAGLVVCVAWADVAWRQVSYWTSSETLFRRAVAVTRGNFLAENNLGEALAREGRLEEAGRHYAEAVRLNPGYPEARNNLGNHLAMHGRYAEAEEQYRAALARRPDMVPAISNLATTRAREHDYAGAERLFRRALALDPRNAGAHFGLGDVLLALGRPAEALAEYEAADRLAPGDARLQARIAAARARAGSS